MGGREQASGGKQRGDCRQPGMGKDLSMAGWRACSGKGTLLWLGTERFWQCVGLSIAMPWLWHTVCHHTAAHQQLDHAAAVTQRQVEKSGDWHDACPSGLLGLRGFLSEETIPVPGWQHCRWHRMHQCTCAHGELLPAHWPCDDSPKKLRFLQPFQEVEG